MRPKVLACLTAFMLLTRLSSALDVQITRVVYDKATSSVSLDILNTGAEPVTAYAIDLDLLCGEKTFNHMSYSTDLLPLILTNQAASGDDQSWRGALLPGKSSTENISMPVARPDQCTASVDAQAKISAYITGDDNSNGTDPKILETLRKDRQAIRRTQEAVVSTLNKYAFTENGIEHALDAFSSLAALSGIASRSAKAGQSSDILNPSLLNASSNDLASIKSSSQPSEALHSYAAYQERRAALMHNMP